MYQINEKEREGWKLRKKRVIKGLRMKLGLSVEYMKIIIIIKMEDMVMSQRDVGIEGLWRIVKEERKMKEIEKRLGKELIDEMVNVVFGVIMDWVMVRYRFEGRSLVDEIVDIKFEMKNEVEGIQMEEIYEKNGWIGGMIRNYGIRIEFKSMGIVIEIILIGMKLVVRKVKKIIEEIRREVEEEEEKIGD